MSKNNFGCTEWNYESRLKSKLLLSYIPLNLSPDVKVSKIMAFFEAAGADFQFTFFIDRIIELQSWLRLCKKEKCLQKSSRPLLKSRLECNFLNEWYMVKEILGSHHTVWKLQKFTLAFFDNLFMKATFLMRKLLKSWCYQKNQ